uniref:Uncharacterized protein n=1 Tax=viral metagenome TaxID=1070528 RepID=A0A2V0RMB6_9ZZZZ
MEVQSFTPDHPIGRVGVRPSGLKFSPMKGMVGMNKFEKDSRSFRNLAEVLAPITNLLLARALEQRGMLEGESFSYSFAWLVGAATHDDDFRRYADALCRTGVQARERSVREGHASGIFNYWDKASKDTLSVAMWMIEAAREAGQLEDRNFGGDDTDKRAPENGLNPIDAVFIWLTLCRASQLGFIPWSYAVATVLIDGALELLEFITAAERRLDLDALKQKLFEGARVIVDLERSEREPRRRSTRSQFRGEDGQTPN